MIDVKLDFGLMILNLNLVLLLGSLVRYETNQKAHFHALTAGLPAAREGGASRGGSWAVGVGW